MLQLHQQHQHQTQQQQHQLATETITIGKRFNAQLHCDRKVNTENRKRNKRSTLERAGSKEPQAVSEFMANGKMANKKLTNKKKKKKAANEEKQFCTPNGRKLQLGSGIADK